MQRSNGIVKESYLNYQQQGQWNNTQDGQWNAFPTNLIENSYLWSKQKPLPQKKGGVWFLQNHKVHPQAAEVDLYAEVDLPNPEHMVREFAAWEALLSKCAYKQSKQSLETLQWLETHLQFIQLCVERPRSHISPKRTNHNFNSVLNWYDNNIT